MNTEEIILLLQSKNNIKKNTLINLYKFIKKNINIDDEHLLKYHAGDVIKNQSLFIANFPIDEKNTDT